MMLRVGITVSTRMPQMTKWISTFWLHPFMKRQSFCLYRSSSTRRNSIGNRARSTTWSLPTAWSSVAAWLMMAIYEHAWNKCICWQNTLRVVLLFILWCIIHNNNNMLFTLYTYFDGAFRLGKWCIQSGALSPEGWCIQTRQMVHSVTSMFQYHYSMNNPSIFILYKTGSS